MKNPAQSARRTAPAKINLFEHWFSAMKTATTDYGAQVFGGPNKGALSGAIKRLRESGKTDQEIARLMDIYAMQPNTWNKRIHPSLDFSSNNTLTRLLHQLSESGWEQNTGSSGSSEVLVAAELPQTLEDLKREVLERGPSWLKK